MRAFILSGIFGFWVKIQPLKMRLRDEQTEEVEVLILSMYWRLKKLLFTECVIEGKYKRTTEWEIKVGYLKNQTLPPVCAQFQIRNSNIKYF